MNCKPGDLAIVHGATWTPELNNRFVIVMRIAREEEYSSVGPPCVVWICRPASGGTLPVRHVSTGELIHAHMRPIGDPYLKPIRDPGEDAQDETLQWLSVPSQHKEVA